MKRKKPYNHHKGHRDIHSVPALLRLSPISFFPDVFRERHQLFDCFNRFLIIRIFRIEHANRAFFFLTNSLYVCDLLGSKFWRAFWNFHREWVSIDSVLIITYFLFVKNGANRCCDRSPFFCDWGLKYDPAIPKDCIATLVHQKPFCDNVHLRGR